MAAIEQTYDSPLSLLEAVYGLDRSWWARAACHGWIKNDWAPTPWTVSTSDTDMNGIKCHKLVDLALLICSGCTAQYDCARYAVDGQIRAGTWSMRIKLLTEFLQKQPDAIELIDQAEAEGAVVQVFVRNAKRERTGA